jgi:FtsZ-interacting cell division protein ZipA
MNGITLVLLIIVAVVIIVAIGMVAFRVSQKRRTEALREKFGPEYDRKVDQADDKRKAESELREREKRHSKLDIRPLKPEQRSEFQNRWAAVQGEFVDDPADAVRDADKLVVEVMSARGYPVDDFDQRADDLSVEHPEVTQYYRKARQISTANQRGEADTEQLRRAVTSFRALIDALLDDSDSGHGTDRDDRRDGRDEGRHEGNHEVRRDDRAGSTAHDTGDDTENKREQRA